MGKIKVLDRNVSDKIAAGEVVERPASVVKELLENAVDAKATMICVEIKNGGIPYMRVTDNGVGMSREDVSLSVLRHATSKIQDEEDLTKISTLGFRGEALSSIAAVATVEIYTKTQTEDSGTHLLAENGEILDVSEAGCPDGTTVVVRNLFSSVPARMKFLKKDFTEAGYIEDIVSRLALSHPEISVKYINNGKEVLFTPGDNLLSSAVYAVYGKDIKNAMVEASFEDRGVSVSGLCGKGTAARGNRAMENFFVNGRYIKSALLARAAEEAYKNELMVGKFPACVLNITLPPENVDINVHPTKLEVKFADEKQVYHCVYWAVKNALYQSAYIPKVSEHKNIKPQFERVPVTPAPEIPKQKTTQQTSVPVQTENFSKPEPKQSMSLCETGGHAVERPTSFMPPVISVNPSRPVREEKPMQSPVQKPLWQSAERQMATPQRKAEPVTPVQAEIQVSTAETKKEIPTYKICGQVFATYIIIEKDGCMLMVDQHAAHERLRYEKLLDQYRGRTVTTQMLISPEVITLTAPEFSAFTEHVDEIRDLGLLAEEFGERQVIVRGTPAEAGECDAKTLLPELLAMLSEHRKNPAEDLASKMLYRIACRGAVKANAVLSHDEMKRLLDDIFMLDGINTCPHGRPITIEMTKEFIEKQFKRIV